MSFYPVSWINEKILMRQVPFYLILKRYFPFKHRYRRNITGTPPVMCLAGKKFPGTSFIRFCWFLIYVAIYISAENSRGKKNRKNIFMF